MMMSENPDRPVKEIIDGLKRYNEWRRGADHKQPNPSDIGKDIDDAINVMKLYVATQTHPNQESG